jgi:hypothetical protein
MRLETVWFVAGVIFGAVGSIIPTFLLYEHVVRAPLVYEMQIAISKRDAAVRNNDDRAAAVEPSVDISCPVCLPLTIQDAVLEHIRIGKKGAHLELSLGASKQPGWVAADDARTRPGGVQVEMYGACTVVEDDRHSSSTDFGKLCCPLKDPSGTFVNHAPLDILQPSLANVVEANVANRRTRSSQKIRTAENVVRIANSASISAKSPELARTAIALDKGIISSIGLNKHLRIWVRFNSSLCCVASRSKPSLPRPLPPSLVDAQVHYLAELH